jgi:hypothetical protein
MFGKDKVKTPARSDAVATARLPLSRGGLYDHIQHDYAIRYINPETGEHEYATLSRKAHPIHPPTLSPG